MCVGFTYKPSPLGEDQPPQKPFVLHSRTNRKLWVKSRQLRNHPGAGPHIHRFVPLLPPNRLRNTTDNI